MAFQLALKEATQVSLQMNRLSAEMKVVEDAIQEAESRIYKKSKELRDVTKRLASKQDAKRRYEAKYAKADGAGRI